MKRKKYIKLLIKLMRNNPNSNWTLDKNGLSIGDIIVDNNEVVIGVFNEFLWDTPLFRCILDSEDKKMFELVTTPRNDVFKKR